MIDTGIAIAAITVDRKLPDLPVALAEDLVAIGLALFAVSRI